MNNYWEHIVSKLPALIFVYDPLAGKVEACNYADQLPEDYTKFFLHAVQHKTSNTFEDAWKKSRLLKENEVYTFTCTLKDDNEKQVSFEIMAKGILNEDRQRRIIFECNVSGSHPKYMLQKNELDDFINLAAHDLYAPVRKLSTLIDMFIAKNKNPSAETVAYVKRIEASLKQLNALVNSLVVLYELRGDGREHTSCDLNKLMNEVMTEMKVILDSNDAVITLTPLPLVRGDAQQLKVLFSNLIYNAVQFRKENSTLEIKINSEILAGKTQIAFDLPLNSGYHCITVADNGIGFDSASEEKIFVPFQRLHGSQHKGSGMGLAICKQIMDNHHGIIYSKGQQNEGARFMIILPEN